MTIWVIKLGACVNNFAYATMETNIDVKFFLKNNFIKCHNMTLK